MERKNYKYFVFLLISFRLFAYSNQFPSGDSDLPDFIDSTSSSSKETPYSAHLQNNKSLPELLKANKASPFLQPFSIKSHLPKLKYYSNSSNFNQQLISSKLPNSEQVLELNNKDLFYKNYNKSRSSFSFSYYLDGFKITDSNSIYERTFGINGSKSGYFIFSLDRSLIKSMVNILWGYDFGFSFNHGNGVFINGDISNTDIKLWILPLELYLKFEIPIFSWSKISVFGGPSIVGLWQTRSDMDQGESNGNAHQSRRQIGYGHMAGAKFSISLSRWLNSTFIDMYKSHEVTNFFITFEGRLQNYGNFLDPFEVKGTTVGLGFSFDFL